MTVELTVLALSNSFSALLISFQSFFLLIHIHALSLLNSIMLFVAVGGGGGLAGLAGAFSSSGAPDLSALLGNPALMNVATQLMADPNMQSM